MGPGRELRLARRQLQTLVCYARRVLVVLNEDNVLALYGLDDGRLLWHRRLAQALQPGGLLASPDGRLLALLYADHGVEVRDAEDGAAVRTAELAACTAARWLPLAGGHSVLCLWNGCGDARLLLDADAELWAGRLAGPPADVAVARDLSRVATVSGGARPAVAAYRTNGSRALIARRVELEARLRALRGTQERWAAYFAARARLDAEHGRVVAELAGSAPAGGLDALLHHVVLLECRDGLGGLRRLYDTRKAYRLRDRLAALADDLWRRLAAASAPGPFQLAPGDVEAARAQTAALQEAQRVLVAWVVACCGPQGAAAPPVRLGEITRALGVLQTGGAAEHAAWVAASFERRAAELVGAADWALRLEGPAEALALPASCEAVALEHAGSELRVFAWCSAEGRLVAHTLLADAEVRVRCCAAEIAAIPRPRDMRLLAGGRLLGLAYESMLLIRDSHTLGQHGHVPWSLPPDGSWACRDAQHVLVAAGTTISIME